jgi:hypothetical protein
MAQSIKLKKRSPLSGWPMILGWLAMLIFAFHASTHMVGAGDTWVALACGRHFINQGISVDKVTVEPFSANSHHAGPTLEEIATWPNWAQRITEKVGINTVKYWHPTGWINQNWLTHVIFYWLVHDSPIADDANLSFNSLIYWKFALYIIAVICVYYTGKILGVNPALSAVFACFAVFIGRSFLDVRPAGFSNMLVAVYMLILALTTYRNILYIWLVVPLTVFWCNVHGGYLYVFIMLVPFIRLYLGAALPKKWIVILNIASFLFFFILLGSKYDEESSSLFLKAFVGLFALAVLDFVQVSFRERFVSIGLRGVCHTVAAGIIAFFAMIIFNPFHLTNLTHTFVIGFSKHAEMWRAVNEWHPAFEWGNPVGTSYPFLVLVILGIGVSVLWLISRTLKPQLIAGPKKEMETQIKLTTALLKTLGCIAAVFIFWVTFVSFSFIDIDSASFLICVIFTIVLLLSVYKSVHFIYLSAAVAIFALWLANRFDPNTNYAGRYIYPLAILPAYVILHFIASLLSKNVKIRAKNIIFVAVAAFAAFVLMVTFFNPFNISGDSWNIASFLHLRKAWSPVYTHNAEPNYAYLLAGLYIISIILVVFWLTISYLQRVFKPAEKIVDNQSTENTYQMPKIDLAMIAIAAISIYMAIRSRRFIPIAAVAACPVLAMLIDQLIRIISAALNFRKEKRFRVTPMSRAMQLFFILVAAVAVLTFGVVWGLKFKRIYLDPWPSDPKLNSVFMRMTASDAKPFYAGQFIKNNKLRGKMFNYWTEGGFIAWAQEPDPNGFTPLKLFMDGRAQAAYEYDKYNLWMDIMSGGPIAQNAGRKGSQLTVAEYMELGKWINGRFKEQKVWVVLMPFDQFNMPSVMALEDNQDWRLVFLDDEQKVFVDVTTPKGKELFDGIFKGRTYYPGEFSKDLIIAHYLLLSPQTGDEMVKQGLDFAIKAFNCYYSPTAMQEIITVARFPQLKSDIDNFCQDYLDKFIKNKVLWSNQDGYRPKVVSAIMAAEHLRKLAVQKNTLDLARSYDAKRLMYNEELRSLNQIRW